MRSGVTVAGAGIAFAGLVILGLALGVWLDGKYHTHWIVVVTLFGGLVLGGYAAYRVVTGSLEV